MKPFKGKVVYAANTIKTAKGFAMGFKIDSFDGFLNFWKDSKEEIPEVSKGSIVQGEYEDHGEYHVISKFERIGFTREEEFKPADSITNIDTIVDKNIMLMNKVTEAYQKTSMAKIFANEPAENGRLIVTLFLSVKDELRDSHKNRT